MCNGRTYPVKRSKGNARFTFAKHKSPESRRSSLSRSSQVKWSASIPKFVCWNSRSSKTRKRKFLTSLRKRSRVSKSVCAGDKGSQGDGLRTGLGHWRWQYLPWRGGERNRDGSSQCGYDGNAGNGYQ